MTALRNNWHQGTPDVGRIVFVWHYLRGVVQAVWNGQDWRALDGDTLDCVEWWHEL